MQCWELGRCGVGLSDWCGVENGTLTMVLSVATDLVWKGPLPGFVCGWKGVCLGSK